MKLRQRSEGTSYDPRVVRMLERHVREQHGSAAITIAKPDDPRRRRKPAA